MITCAEAVRQLWEYLEQDLSTGDRAGVEEHLAFCRRCCGEAEFTAELQRFLRAASDPPVPSEVESRLEGFLDRLVGEAP